MIDIVTAVLNSDTLNKTDIPEDIAHLALEDRSKLAGDDLAILKDFEDGIFNQLSDELAGKGFNNVTDEELNFAVEGFMNFADPQASLEHKLVVGSDATQGDINGSHSEASFALEAFDSAAVTGLRGLNAAYVLLSRKPVEILQAMDGIFRPLNIGKAGGISTRITVPFLRGPSEHNPGVKYRPEEQRLINQLDSDTTYDRQPVFPIVGTAPAEVCSDPADIPPVSVRVWDEDVEKTTYLFGKMDIDYLGNAQTPKGITRGLYDNTDMLTSANNIGNIYLDFDGEIGEFDLSKMSSSDYSASRQGSETGMNLICKETIMVTDETETLNGAVFTTLTIPAGHSVIIEVQIHGSVDQQDGTGGAILAACDFKALLNEAGELVPDTDPAVATLTDEVAKVMESDKNAYLPNMQRVNSNLRTLGPTIDQRVITEGYYPGYGEAMTVERPVNRAELTDTVAKLAALNTINIVRDGLQTLEDAATVLSNQTRKGTMSAEYTPKILGTAREVLNTTYKHAVIDFNSLSSVTHSGRENDIIGFTTGVLNNLAHDIWHSAGYTIALTTTAAGISAGKPQMHLVTTERMAVLINQGKAALTDKFNWHIEGIPTNRLTDKAYMVINFNGGTTETSFNPLNFGIRCWSATNVYPVANMSKNDRHTKSYTVIPVSNCFVNAPVMGVVEFENFNTAYGNNP